MEKQENKQLVEFLTKFIVESDAIESIEDNPNVVRKQLEANSPEGHVGALLLLESLSYEEGVVLTEDIVREVQGLITAEQHVKPGGSVLPLEYVGKYRLVNVLIGGRRAPLPIAVPILMMDWIMRVENWQKHGFCQANISNLLQIARFHFEYENIHPFADGNGRSGRAIVYYLMRYCDLDPFIFTAADRFETYYRCFQDPEAMCKYFEEKFCRTLVKN